MSFSWWCTLVGLVLLFTSSMTGVGWMIVVGAASIFVGFVHDTDRIFFWDRRNKENE